MRVRFAWLYDASRATRKYGIGNYVLAAAVRERIKGTTVVVQPNSSIMAIHRICGGYVGNLSIHTHIKSNTSAC